MLVCLYKKLLGLLSPKQTQRPSIRGRLTSANSRKNVLAAEPPSSEEKSLFLGPLAAPPPKIYPEHAQVSLRSQAINTYLIMSSTHDLHINHHQSLRKKYFADVIKVLTRKRIKHNHTWQAKQSVIGVPSTRIRIFRIQKLFLPIQKYLRTQVSFSNHLRSSTTRILFRLKMEIFLYRDWPILLGTDIHF